MEIRTFTTEQMNEAMEQVMPQYDMADAMDGHTERSKLLQSLARAAIQSIAHGEDVMRTISITVMIGITVGLVLGQILDRDVKPVVN